MKTLKLKDVTFKNDELKNAIELMLNNNFKIFAYFDKRLNKITFAMFTENNNIGYIQTGDFGHGVKYSTVHKPNHNVGTGFGLCEDAEDNPTIEDLRKAFMVAPNWARRHEVESVEKYKNIDEYFSKPINQILEYSILIK